MPNQPKPTNADILAGKDRLIGELYSQKRAIEEAYAKLMLEHETLKTRVNTAEGNPD